jgi:hypothetical protein
MKRIISFAVALLLITLACGLPPVNNASGGIVPTDTTMPSTIMPLPTDTPTPIPALPTETPTATWTPTLLPSSTSSVPMIAPASVAVNCRYGPGAEWLATGALKVGQSVPVRGTNNSHSWWQIDSSWNPGTLCWVSGAVTTITGNTSSVPVHPIPTALVTNVTVTTSAVVHGFCGGPNAVGFQGAITTNGPATVVFHWEIWVAGGARLFSTADTPLVFASASTKTNDPGAHSRDCGNYVAKLVVTSPNSIVGQANFSVVQP